jgi:hypothetical protein
MTNTPTYAELPPTGRRATISSVLAWLCLALALLFPLGMLLNAGVLLVTAGLAYPLAFVYNALDYLGMLVAVLAVVLGHLARLAAGGQPGLAPQRRIARTGLIIGYGSLAFIVVVLVMLIAVG